MRKPRKREILRATAKVTGTSVAALVGPSRKNGPALARHVAIAVAYFLGYSYQEAAELLGRVNHRSAIWAKNHVEKDARASALFDAVLSHLTDIGAVQA